MRREQAHNRVRSAVAGGLEVQRLVKGVHEHDLGFTWWFDLVEWTDDRTVERADAELTLRQSLTKNAAETRRNGVLNRHTLTRHVRTLESTADTDSSMLLVTYSSACRILWEAFPRDGLPTTTHAAVSQVGQDADVRKSQLIDTNWSHCVPRPSATVASVVHPMQTA